MAISRRQRSRYAKSNHRNDAWHGIEIILNQQSCYSTVALARIQANYLSCGYRTRENGQEFRKYHPDWKDVRLRW